MQLTVSLLIELGPSFTATTFVLGLMTTNSAYGVPAEVWAVFSPCVEFPISGGYIVPVDSVNVGTALNPPIYVDLIMGYTGVVAAPFTFSPAIFLSGGGIQIAGMFAEIRYARLN